MVHMYETSMDIIFFFFGRKVWTLFDPTKQGDGHYLTQIRSSTYMVPKL